jgi:uncharacterized protein YfdQ (DUF2303 family)
MTNVDNLQPVIDTAIRSASPTELQPGKVYAWLTTGGNVQKVDLTGDEYRDTPTRKTGTTTVRDAASFLEYFGKHSDADSEVYADTDRLTVTAVLDAHAAEGARWGKHRLTLALRTTEAWNQWSNKDNHLMSQEEFAEHLEDHLAELVAPPAAEMLEIAQSFQATTKAEFASSTRLASGQRQFQYVETTTAKAGQKGSIAIPETFEIGLVPFEGSAAYKLTARFRHRIQKDALLLGYKLDRPREVLDAAFADVLTEISAAINPPILNGTPASS